jgi:hypothetical protein
VLFLFGAGLTGGRAASHHSAEAAPDEVAFKVAGEQFSIPSKWTAETPETSVRAGQWRVPGLRGTAPTPVGADGELIVFYFGPGLGGTAQENIYAWRSSVLDADGHPVAGEIGTREIAGSKITELVAFGSYRDPVPIPGLPPLLRPGYGLAAAVVETPRGNLYWRLTGPAPLVTETLPLLRKILDGMKPPVGG